MLQIDSVTLNEKCKKKISCPIVGLLLTFYLFSQFTIQTFSQFCAQVDNWVINTVFCNVASRVKYPDYEKPLNGYKAGILSTHCQWVKATLCKLHFGELYNTVFLHSAGKGDNYPLCRWDAWLGWYRVVFSWKSEIIENL